MLLHDNVIYLYLPNTCLNYVCALPTICLLACYLYPRHSFTYLPRPTTHLTSTYSGPLQAYHQPYVYLRLAYNLHVPTTYPHLPTTNVLPVCNVPTTCLSIILHLTTMCLPPATCLWLTYHLPLITLPPAYHQLTTCLRSTYQ